MAGISCGVRKMLPLLNLLLQKYCYKEQKNIIPSHMLYQYELTMKLLETALLLKNRKLGSTGISKRKPDIINWFINRERKRLQYYPSHLEPKEIIKPARVFKSIFDTYDLTYYNRVFRNWLYDALSDKFMEKSLTKTEVLYVYDRLVKLYEVMWLVHNRSCLSLEDVYKAKSK
ncbi:hypothetical protein [Pedobacter sp. SYP-B3415]|uniref:hypothetical protein n=1 Tax=Pedobacter sp. SYP-B3415 TaxID=2496641 RepID=UPI00101D75CD|nr:hypothetical protein [Pedobacter sp. SYP-B3415]